MSEREIRSRLRAILAELDGRARRVARKVVVPSMLGAGLALSGCGDGRPVGDDAKVDAKVVSEMGPLYAAPVDAAYMAPDWGVQPPYMAPDGGMLYMAPDMAYMAPDAGPQPPYMSPDAGPSPEYIAPPPDGAPTPPYMGPDV